MDGGSQSPSTFNFGFEKTTIKNGSYPVQISVHRLAGPVQSPSRFCTYPKVASSYSCSEFSKKKILANLGHIILGGY